MPRSSDRTRGQILDRAYKLFYRRGYSRVSIDEIAAGDADHGTKSLLSLQKQGRATGLCTAGPNLSLH